MNLFNEILTNSHDGNYNQITDIICRYFSQFEDCNLIIQNISENKSNVIVKWGDPDLLINAHLDTVIPNNGWSTNPYELIELNGNLYGLGVCDTKGNIYALYEALKLISPKNLMLLFSVDEESNSIESGVTHFLATDYYKNIKQVIVCEPTNNNIADAHKGYYAFYLKTNAPSRHSSKSEYLCDNAIYKLGKYFDILVNEGYNLGKITGGSAGNIIAPECLLHISIRSENDYDTVYTNLKCILEDEVIIETKTVLPALKSNPSETKSKYPINSIPLEFWTEASLFQKKGIDSVIYGVGDILQAHSANEFISKKSLNKGINFFTEVIKNENKK